MATQVVSTRRESPGRPPHRAPRAGWRNRLSRLDVKASPYLYISPFFLLFFAFGLFPIIYTGWVSLHDWDLLATSNPYTGLENYRVLFADPYFWNAAVNTLSILFLSTAPQLLFAIVLAHFLNRPLRGQSLFRLGLLLPNVTSVVAVAVIFSQLFGRDFGLINYVLEFFGAGRIDWDSGRASSHIALSTMIIWRWTGYNALIYLAAMQAIPRDLYESATLDGASEFRQLRSITVPMIRPTIIFTVISSTIFGMQVLAEPLLFGGGGPQGITGGSSRQFQTLTLYLYESGFQQFNFGYASTIAWMMFLIIMVIAAVNYLLIRRIRSV